MQTVDSSWHWPDDAGYWYSLWSFGSFTSCSLLQHWISPYLFNKRSSVYRQLSSVRQLEWNCRFVSTIHAVAVTTLSFLALVKDSALWTNPIFSVSRSGLIAMSITVGYMISDSIAMIMFDTGIGLYLFLIHHIIAAVAFSYVITYRVAAFFGVLRLTSEASTPLLNLRWFLRSTYNEEVEGLIAVISVLFWTAFTLIRHFSIIPYWWLFYKCYNSPKHLHIAPHLPRITICVIISSAILDMLNIFWGIPVYRIGIKGLQKIVIFWRGPQSIVSFETSTDHLSNGSNSQNHTLDCTCTPKAPQHFHKE